MRTKVLFFVIAVVWGFSLAVVSTAHTADDGGAVIKPQKGAATKPQTGAASYTDSMKMVFVKGGCFQMGDTFGDGEPNEKPVHEVCVDDFYMAETEVTQKQWKDVMGNNPSYSKNCDKCPVDTVSWNDAQKYITGLNSKAGKTYRLPTEAEWEYAARSGGKKEKYAGGNDVNSVAWYESNSGKRTHPVKQKKPNGLGLYDMSGNVREWVQDWYDVDYYKSSPKNNPQNANSGIFRALRGGSWDHVARLNLAMRRGRHYQDYQHFNIGFRLVLSAK